MRASTAISTVLVALLIGAGIHCTKKKGGGKNGAMGKPAPNKCRPGNYSQIPKLKPRSATEHHCYHDSDCVVTTLMPGTCCNHGCNERFTYTRDFNERLRKHQRLCCDGAKYECKQYSCPQAQHKITARCSRKRCVLVRTKIKR